MTALPSPSERERARSMEPIRPIVRRVIVQIEREQDVPISFLEDPAILSLYGEPVIP